MSFTFIDLFAGIGGLRIAMERAGGECVFSSEYDRFAQETYKAFFGEKPVFNDLVRTDPPGDITRIEPNRIPDHDILSAGFPCQPFSLAGVSKKQSLGRAHGFDDPTQGTLFFTLKEIIRTKRPKAFLLENVKNIRSHDSGRTYRLIMQSLDEIGYEVASQILDARAWTPQHRERTFFVGFRRPELMQGQKWKVKAQDFDFRVLTPKRRLFNLNEVLQPSVDSKYTLGPGTWDTLVRHKRHHESIGQGFAYGLIKKPFDNKTTRTLSARYHKDGAEILIYQGSKKRPRRLTPLECCRLMGFPKNYQRFFDPADNEMEQPVSDTQAYRQFGNSVSVPVVTDISRQVVAVLNAAKQKG